MSLVKYIVCFQQTIRNGNEKKTRVQFYQYWTRSAAEAREKAILTCEMLAAKTNTEWIIEGVYCKCDL